MTEKDSGFYACSSVSSSGALLARVEVRVLTAADRPPPIIQLGPVNQTLKVGSTASFPCEATQLTSAMAIDVEASQDELQIHWLKDGVHLFSPSVKDPRVTVGEDHGLVIEGRAQSHFVFFNFHH